MGSYLAHHCHRRQMQSFELSVAVVQNCFLQQQFHRPVLATSPIPLCKNKQFTVLQLTFNIVHATTRLFDEQLSDSDGILQIEYSDISLYLWSKKMKQKITFLQFTLTKYETKILIFRYCKLP